MAVMFKEQEYSIRTFDVDFKDNILPSAVLDYFQNMAGNHASDIGVGFTDMVNKGFYWVVLYNQFEIVSRMPRYDERVLVSTWPKPQGKIEFEREYEICDKNKNVLIKGVSNWVLIDTAKRSLARADNAIFIGEYYEKQNYTDKQKRKLGLKSDSFDKAINYRVRLSDLDHNLHMNNGKYMEIIHNMFDMETYKPWKKVEIAFIHEAKLNDVITVKHFIDIDLNDCFIGYLENEVCFEAKLTREE